MKPIDPTSLSVFGDTDTMKKSHLLFDEDYQKLIHLQQTIRDNTGTPVSLSLMLNNLITEENLHDIKQRFINVLAALKK